MPVMHKGGSSRHRTLHSKGSQRQMETEARREHAYYYQLQVQLNVCQLEYGDFVLWAENGLAVERITRDTKFYEQNADSGTQKTCCKHRWYCKPT